MVIAELTEMEDLQLHAFPVVLLTFTLLEKVSYSNAREKKGRTLDPLMSDIIRLQLFSEANVQMRDLKNICINMINFIF